MYAKNIDEITIAYRLGKTVVAIPDSYHMPESPPVPETNHLRMFLCNTLLYNIANTLVFRLLFSRQQRISKFQMSLFKILEDNEKKSVPPSLLVRSSSSKSPDIVLKTW